MGREGILYERWGVEDHGIGAIEVQYSYDRCLGRSGRPGKGGVAAVRAAVLAAWPAPMTRYEDELRSTQCWQAGYSR